mmetsp:Transcript_6579/g.10253  ORF Transcript_6579/g.10253 Transcript_6579/m.10253 type:complete len:237 (-) Transcript_6579:906-1616(-)
MSIILLETTHSSQPSEGTRKFVSVQHTKIGVSNGQIAIGSDLGSKHKAMAGAVHWFHRPFLTLHIETKHSILVMHGMARLMPQIQVVNVWSDDFIVSTIPVLLSNKLNEFVVNTAPMRKPKGRSSRQIVKHNKLLLGSNASVVTFLSLFHIFLPHFKLLLVGEGNTVKTLQRVVVGVTQPVRCRVSRGGKRLDLASVRHMRATTQIDQITTLVDRSASSIGYLGGQNLNFERVVSK